MSSTAYALNLELKSVLLATDLSPASAKPLNHALGIARHYGAKLYIAYVLPAAPYLMAGSEALRLGGESAEEEMQELHRELLKQGSLDGLNHEMMVRCGSSISEELQAIISEKEIGLVVLGTHGRCGLEKLILGSVAEEVFRDAACPVLTVGPHSYRQARLEFGSEPHTFLFATDFSDASLASLPHAVSFASRSNATLVLLHVIRATPLPEGRSASEDMQMRENARMSCVRRLELLVADCGHLQIQVEFLVQFGLPSEKILQVALDKRVDLIILGLRRALLTGTLSHMPWATAYEIVRGAGCPVLTVRE